MPPSLTLECVLTQEKVQASQERLGFQLTAGTQEVFWDANKKVLWYQGRGFSMSDLVVMQTLMSATSIPILCYAATSDSMDNPATVQAFADMIAGYERLKELNYPSAEAADAALTGSCTVDNKFVVQDKMLAALPPLKAKRDAILAQNVNLRSEGKQPVFSGETAAAAAATSPGNPRGLRVLAEDDEDLEDTEATLNACSANNVRRASPSVGFHTDVASAYSTNLRLVEQLWESGRDGDVVTLRCLDKPQRKAMYHTLQSKYAGRIDFDKDDLDVLFKPIEIRRTAQQGTRIESSSTMTREQLYALQKRRKLLEEHLKTIDPNWNADLIRQDAWHFLDRLLDLSSTKRSPMFKIFATMLSQAMFKFVEHSNDPSVASREAVKEHIKKLYGEGMSATAFEDFLEIVPHSYWVSHCRRWCPPPNVMIKDIIDVYMAFVGVLDPHTATKACPDGFSFFKAGHEDLLKTQLEYIATGCLSDLPDRCMYISVGAHPTTGLEIFKCIRGSNDLEGALLYCFLLSISRC